MSKTKVDPTHGIITISFTADNAIGKWNHNARHY